MKVYIGTYKNWFGPYQLASLLCFWAKKKTDKYGFKQEPDWVHNFGRWLAEKKVYDDQEISLLDKNNDSLLAKFFGWVHRKRKRTVYVKIDKYDSWNADGTLSYIIVPLLKQLRDTKHGSPHVDDEDVPEELRSTSAPSAENDYGIDANHHKRWEWVLNEMIWAFEQKIPENDWEAQYSSGEIDFVGISDQKDENGKTTMYRLEHGPNHTYKCDYDGIAEHEKRIRRGTILFGKYYSSLWD